MDINKLLEPSVQGNCKVLDLGTLRLCNGCGHAFNQNDMDKKLNRFTCEKCNNN
jgi:hypothetical protein